MSDRAFGDCLVARSDIPFAHAIVDRLLPDDFYQSLIDTFPFAALGVIKGERGEYRQPGKSIRRYDGTSDRKRAKFLLPISEPWREFFELCQGGAMKELIERTFAREFDADGLQFEIASINADGGAVHPHFDSGNKIVSGIYYMPQPGWQSEWGGALRLLALKNSLNPSAYPDWQECRTVVEAAYIPNRLVLFRTKKNVSYHGVKPMRGPADARRTSVTFALMREGK